MKYPDVNGHLHTPYSFCSFESIEEAVEMAHKEKIAAIGINDFFTTDGYEEWDHLCRGNGIAPMFNFEFIGVSVEEQANNIRINDPGNPGRIYMSGKGLAHPFKLDESYASQFEKVRLAANVRSEMVCAKLNKHMASLGAKLEISFVYILEMMTKGMVRERHIAKAIRDKLFQVESTEGARRALLEKIYNGKNVGVDINDAAALENEIRAVLLKAGGAAFIPEDPEFFLPMDAVRDIILNGKGMPTYPVLGNALGGGFTEFEVDKEVLLAKLKAKRFFAVEFITTRNTTAMLEEYGQFFVDNGFVVTFGSEHNTPSLEPITLYTADHAKLSQKLKKINYEGACITVAHQQLVAQGKDGWLDLKGMPDTSKYKEFVEIGDKIILG